MIPIIRVSVEGNCHVIMQNPSCLSERLPSPFHLDGTSYLKENITGCIYNKLLINLFSGQWIEHSYRLFLYHSHRNSIMYFAVLCYMLTIIIRVLMGSVSHGGTHGSVPRTARLEGQLQPQNVPIVVMLSVLDICG